MTETARLALPLLAPAQAQKHVTVNEALRLLDALVQARVEGALAAPPADPAEGQAWIVAAPATGAWAGWEGDIALRAEGGWLRLAPAPGWRVWDAGAGTLLVRSGAAFVPLVAALGAVTLAGLASGEVPRLGVGAAADAVNGLVFRGTNALLHSAGGIDATLNKGVTAAEASLSFKVGWSARAILGLLGDEALRLRVSADGALLRDALVADAATGRVTLPGGLRLDVPLTGAAVTATPHDTAPGRLTKVGDAGLLLDDAAPAAPVADMDAWRVSGLWRWADATVGRPAGSWGGAFLHIVRAGAAGTGAQVQLAFDAGTGRIQQRVLGAGLWSPWREVWHAGSALRAVAQSAGEPAGGLIERGANANGAFVRFADGTQLCTHQATASLAINAGFWGGFRSPGQTWVFPAAFAAAPAVTVTALAGTAFGATLPWDVAATNAPWSVTAVASQATAAERRVSLTAVGRWF